MACLIGIVSCFCGHFCAKFNGFRRRSQSLDTSTEDLVSSESTDQDAEEVIDYSVYAKNPPDYEQGVKMPVPLYVRLARQLHRPKPDGNDTNTSTSVTVDNDLENGNPSLGAGASSSDSVAQRQDAATPNQLPSYEEAVSMLSSGGQCSSTS